MSLKDLDSPNEKYKPVSSDDEVLARMRMGKKTISEIRMGTQIIPVRILSADEVNAIWRHSRLETAKNDWHETDQNYYVQKYTLQLATAIDDTNIPFLTEKRLSKLTIDEIAYLYNELIKFWDDCNPALNQITPESFRELVEALKKNKISWSDCTLPQRKAIFTCFVEMIQKQDTPTSPPDNSPGGLPVE